MLYSTCEYNIHDYNTMYSIIGGGGGGVCVGGPHNRISTTNIHGYNTMYSTIQYIQSISYNVQIIRMLHRACESMIFKEEEEEEEFGGG